MKKLSLVPLALVLTALLVSSTAQAQNYNRAKNAARRVAPSPTPTTPPARSAPYQAPSQTPVQPPAPTPQPIPSAQAMPSAPVARSRVVEPPRPKVDKAEVLKKTVEFQKKKAEEGSATAQYDLGMRYLKGDGVDKDEEAGLKWLGEASKNGNHQAEKKLKELDELKKEAHLGQAPSK
jgi:TPR repeat protein